MPKRIIDGKTYDTNTATRIASSPLVDWQDVEYGVTDLYLTRSGAFFLVEQTDWDDCDRDWAKNTFRPLTRDEAEAWTLEGDVEILAPVFVDPPEAEGEEPGQTEARIYFRVPVSLRDRLARAAEADGLSLNSLMLRISEEALRRRAVKPAPDAA